MFGSTHGAGMSPGSWPASSIVRSSAWRRRADSSSSIHIDAGSRRWRAARAITSATPSPLSVSSSATSRWPGPGPRRGPGTGRHRALQAGGSSTERRADLQAFLVLCAQELAGLVQHAGRDLEEIQANLDHIRQILADQHGFSRAQRVIEPVRLTPLIQESVARLPQDLRPAVRVGLAPELGRLGPVYTARVARQQVVGNLLINAAEAGAPCGIVPWR